MIWTHWKVWPKYRWKGRIDLNKWVTVSCPVQVGQAVCHNISDRERDVSYLQILFVAKSFKPVLIMLDEWNMATSEMVQEKVEKSLPPLPSATQMTRELSWDRRRSSALSAVWKPQHGHRVCKTQNFHNSAFNKSGRSQIKFHCSVEFDNGDIAKT